MIDTFRDVKGPYIITQIDAAFISAANHRTTSRSCMDESLKRMQFDDGIKAIRIIRATYPVLTTNRNAEWWEDLAARMQFRTSRSVTFKILICSSSNVGGVSRVENVHLSNNLLNGAC